MKSKKKINLYLIGGGGHAKSCIEILNRLGNYKIKKIIDPNIKEFKPYYVQKKLDDKILKKRNVSFLITIGQIKNFKKRKYYFNYLKKNNFKLETIIADTSYISKNSSIGEGSIIMHQTFINYNVVVGNNTIINNRAHLEHDVKVGDHCHISTGAILNGNVVVGKHTFIGSGCIVFQGVKIGQNCVISAGKIVKKNIKNNEILK